MPFDIKFTPYTTSNGVDAYNVSVNGKFAGELYMEVDGYYVYWPDNRSSGFVDAWYLRAVADKLDELNAAWDAQIQREIGGD